MAHATDALQQRITRLSISDEATTEGSVSADINSGIEDEEIISDCLTKKGGILHRFLDSHGLFEGKVSVIDSNVNIKVHCNDGNQEVLTQEELNTQKKASTLIGEIGMKFIKNFSGNFCVGKVIKIHHNLKRVCILNYN